MKKGTIIHGSRLKEILREEVREALGRQDVKTREIAEFYLVNLLSDYHSAEYIVDRDGEDSLEKPLALLFMEAMDGDLPARIKKLKSLGDRALILSGFFSASIRKKLVDLPYYVSMGGHAYGSLANILSNHGTFSELYAELAAKFASFVDVLAIVAPWNRALSNTDLLRIYDRWIATGDETLKVLLDERGISTGDIMPVIKP